MKIESLKLDKFKRDALTREQMFMLNGGGIATAAGNVCLYDSYSASWRNCDYGYDAYRSDGSTTYHNRTYTDVICAQPSV